MIMREEQRVTIHGNNCQGLLKFCPAVHVLINFLGYCRDVKEGQSTSFWARSNTKDSQNFKGMGASSLLSCRAELLNHVRRSASVTRMWVDAD